MKPYSDQIIHLFGGMHEFVGELCQKPHKMGKDWYRILNPCMVSQMQDPVKKTLTNVLVFLSGSEDAYKKYVDIRIPHDFAMEIRTVNKGSNMHKIYKQEVERAPRAKAADGSNLIEVPSFGIGGPVNPN